MRVTSLPCIVQPCTVLGCCFVYKAARKPVLRAGGPMRPRVTPDPTVKVACRSGLGAQPRHVPSRALIFARALIVIPQFPAQLTLSRGGVRRDCAPRGKDCLPMICTTTTTEWNKEKTSYGLYSRSGLHVLLSREPNPYIRPRLAWLKHSRVAGLHGVMGRPTVIRVSPLLCREAPAMFRT